MGFLDNLRKGASDIPKEWKIVKEEKQLDVIWEASHTKPQAIFKHSISCGISSSVKSSLANEAELLSELVDVHYLDLINFRSVSNLVADKSGVIHQSPQLIIIVNGKVKIADSHFALTPEFVKKHLEN